MARYNLREKYDISDLNSFKSSISKIETSVSKAIDAVKKVDAELSALLGEEGTQKISNINQETLKIPNNLSNFSTEFSNIIQKLNNMIDPNNGSSMSKTAELINTLPVGSFDKKSPGEVKKDLDNRVNLNVNYSDGPQSAIGSVKEQTLEDFYRNVLQEEVNTYEYDDNTLSFNSLRENNIFGVQYDGDMMAQFSKNVAKPVPQQERTVIREQMRAAADDEMFEDTEHLTEGTKLDFSRMKAFGGSDGMPLKFDALGGGGHIV